MHAYFASIVVNTVAAKVNGKDTWVHWLVVCLSLCCLLLQYLGLITALLAHVWRMLAAMRACLKGLCVRMRGVRGGEEQVLLAMGQNRRV